MIDHNLAVTISSYHHPAFSLSPSQSCLHHLSITISLSPSLRNHLVITISLSQSCRHNLTISPSRLLPLSVTISPSPSRRYHLTQSKVGTRWVRQPFNAILYLSHKNSDTVAHTFPSCQYYCKWRLPQQFTIPSSPHCPFSFKFIQSTTKKFRSFSFGPISQTLSQFIISSSPFIPDPLP